MYCDKSFITKFRQRSYFTVQDETSLTGKSTMSSAQSPQYIYSSILQWTQLVLQSLENISVVHWIRTGNEGHSVYNESRYFSSIPY